MHVGRSRYSRQVRHANAERVPLILCQTEVAVDLTIDDAVPDAAASYEFYSVALLQRDLAGLVAGGSTNTSKL